MKASFLRAAGFLPAIALLFVPMSTLSQDSDLGQFENHTDIGPVKHPGTLAFDAETGEYRLSGSGTNMWSTSDEFHYVWKSIQG